MYQVGDIVDDEYEVLRVFTNGGMGVVYKVHHMGWNIDMAMKCPRAELFANDDSKKSFIKECQTWMDLGIHPNIVTCFYIKNINSTPAIFAEYADGGSLADFINSAKLYSGTPEQVLQRILDIAIQTARGLEYAQRRGYVHQDIKPANILLTSRGVAKVSDFGLSKASKNLSNYSLPANSAQGIERSILVSSGGCTPAYCSPEQILDRKITHRTDIWSWALMFLEMIHGGIFWRFGAEAARRLDKLWSWQVFSSQVKKCGDFLALLRVCINEDAEKRPHDFSAIEQRLVAIYVSLFGDYPRRKPNDILMSAGTLCNRIAGYSELVDFGEDISHKIHLAMDELRKNVRWAAWGEINRAVYWLKSGERVAEVSRLLENMLQCTDVIENQKWLVDFMLSLGKTSPRLKVFSESPLSAELRNRISVAHNTLREELRHFFSEARHCPNPFAYKPLPFYDSDSRIDVDEPLEETEDGYLIGKAVSQNGKCNVTVSFAKTEPGGKTDDDKHLIVRAKVGGKSFVCSDRIPDYTQIRFITVDDNCSMLSLWLSKRQYNETVFYRQVSRIANGQLMPYLPDYRNDEKWGRLAKIWQSGDAKRLMTIGMDGECSLWVNEKGDSSDGRNVCEIDLKEYGLIPPDVLLPNLVLEEGFEYELDEDLGYRLMAFLAAKYGGIRRSCKIFLPESSEEEEKISRRGASIIDEAVIADRKGLFLDEARLLSDAIKCGVMPSEEKMARRHKIITSGRNAVIRDVWLNEEKKEHWEIKEALFPREGTPAFESFWTHLHEGEKIRRSIILCPLSQNDVLALVKDDEELGRPVIGITRLHSPEKFFPSISNCSFLSKVWMYRFPEPEFNYRVCDALKLEHNTVKLLLYGNRTVVLDLDFGTVIEERMRDEEDSIREKQSSNNGRYALVNVKWALLIKDYVRKSSEVVVKWPEHSPWFARFCISEDGLAAAIIANNKLFLYCVNSHRVVFDWRLPNGDYQDMCFDKTGRWLSILYDNHNVLTFQLLWDLPETSQRKLTMHE